MGDGKEERKPLLQNDIRTEYGNLAGDSVPGKINCAQGCIIFLVLYFETYRALEMSVLNKELVTQQLRA